MAITIAQLTQTATLSVGLHNGEELVFTPRAWDAKLARFLKDAETPANDGEIVAEFLVRFLAELIDSWEVIDGDGRQVPPSREILAQMHTGDLVRIRDRATEYLFPNSLAAGDSADGSPAAATSETPPDGSTTSSSLS